MTATPATHTPVAAGPAYAEAVRRLPSSFTATIKAEPGNRFNCTAVAVFSGSDKIGYLPADLSRRYFPVLNDAHGVGCPGRRSPHSAEENTGVEVLLDLTGVPCAE